MIFLVIEALCYLAEPLYNLIEISSRKNTSCTFWRLIIRDLNTLLEAYKDDDAAPLGDFYPLLIERDKNHLSNCSKLALKTLAKYHAVAYEAEELIIGEFFNPITYSYGFLDTEKGLTNTDGKKLDLSITAFKNNVLNAAVNEIMKCLNVFILSNIAASFPQLNNSSEKKKFR